MKKLTIFWIGLLGCMSSMQAQDSLSTYQRMILQQQSEQAFKKEYYYNPVHKLGYSNFSFSDILVNQSKEKKERYKLQEGSGKEGIEIAASSFKKLSNDRSIWGNVVYQNNSQKNIQWNANLDLDIIAPYVMADSTKGSMKYEAYEFLGGYAQKIKKFSFALEVAYQAHLGFKNKDPRPKNISSNITIKGGIGYELTQQWTAGAYALYTNYTQNTDVTFVNQTQKAALYQMNGLGTWNRYFSGKSTGTNFESNGYEYGLNLENKALDFSIGFTKGSTTLKKFFKGVNLSNSSGDAEGNRLESDYYSIFALKFFQINEHRIGLKYNYSQKDKEGIEVYYTDNETNLGLVKLLEKKMFLAKESSHVVEGMYEVNFPKSRLVAKPFWKYQKNTERLNEFNSKQNFTSNYYGLNLSYTQALSPSSTIEIAPAFTYRNTNQATHQYNLLQSKQAIEDWLMNDFDYFTANYLAWGTTVKYAIEKVKNAPMFISITYNQVDFKKNKQNNYLGVTIGVTF